MGYTALPDKSDGDVFTETMWDTIKDNINTGIPVLFADTTLGAAAVSIDLTDIPQTHAHLYLVAYLRGDSNAVNVDAYLRFNGDTGNNYDRQQMSGQGATPGAAEVFANGAIYVGHYPALTAPASVFAGITMEVFHYSQGVSNKIVDVQAASKWGTSVNETAVWSIGGFWRSNALIDQITLYPSNGNWVVGSRVSLYGMP